MSFELREGQGALFKHDKQGNEKAPDYKGNGMFAGKRVEIAGWIREGKNGKFLRLKLEEPCERRASQSERQQARHEPDSFPSDIPF